MTQLNYSDFYQVPELKFDITKLREDLDTILKKRFCLSKGVSNFRAIPLNQIQTTKTQLKEIVSEEFIGLWPMDRGKK